MVQSGTKNSRIIRLAQPQQTSPATLITEVSSWCTGHDEDPAKTQMGTPLERILKMGTAMLEVVKNFKPPSSDGKKFQIRLGVIPLWTAPS